jgi:hypothetical protein
MIIVEANSLPIPGQLSSAERELLTNAILRAPKPPKVVLEVGDGLGGGSMLHTLQELQQKGEGHPRDIEADRSVQADGIVLRILRQRRFSSLASGGN